MGKEFSEKPQIELVEEIERMQTETTNPAFEKKTIRRIDWRLLPLPAAVHAISLVDRANLGIARTAGMGKDLGLDVGNRFSLLSGLYFVLYIPFLLPSNFYARIFGVRLWLTICVISWGTVQLGEGFVKSWNQLLACRILLGAFEAGFFPPLVFITTWYKRHEVQKRLAVFYLASIVIAGFSGIFSYGITFLHGKGGLGAWNWIFIIEGILTLVLGILTLLFAVGFPQSNKFLSEKETKFVLARVQEDRGDALADDMTVAKVLHHLCDWILWAYPLMYLSSTMPAYAIGLFTSILLNGMGFNTRDSLLLVTPPYVVAAASCYLFAWLSDKTKMRAPFIAIQAMMTVAGMAVTGWAASDGARYFGLFLANSGASGCIPSILAYSSNNIVGHSKRAVLTTMLAASGSIGGVLASTAFREQDAPRYLLGIWVVIGVQFLTLSLLVLLSWHFARKNRLSREGKLDTPLEGQPGFFYTL